LSVLLGLIVVMQVIAAVDWPFCTDRVSVNPEVLASVVRLWRPTEVVVNSGRRAAALVSVEHRQGYPRSSTVL
jgi:hypothetical protein